MVPCWRAFLHHRNFIGELMDHYIKCWTQAFDFQGRASRSEFWMFALCNGILSFSLVVVGLPQVYAALLLVTVIPNISVATRRLHDIDMSGLWLLVAWIPIINLIFLYFFCCDSTPGANKYGPSPKSDSPAIPAGA